MTPWALKCVMSAEISPPPGANVPGNITHIPFRTTAISRWFWV
jgi:hypothetical protein